jgi:hypothetical protein
MWLAGTKFFIISFIFFGGGGLFEWLMMRRPYPLTKPFRKKRTFLIKISEGVMWVHEIVFFIAIRRTTIYDFKKLGYIPSISAYIIMLFYVLIAYILYPIISYLAFLVYLIPVITNISFLVKYSKKIKQYRDILKKK